MASDDLLLPLFLGIGTWWYLTHRQTDPGAAAVVAAATAENPPLQNVRVAGKTIQADGSTLYHLDVDFQGKTYGWGRCYRWDGQSVQRWKPDCSGPETGVGAVPVSQPRGPDGGPPIPTGTGETVTTPGGRTVPIIRAQPGTFTPGSPATYTPGRWATPPDVLIRSAQGDLSAAVESAKYDLADYLNLPPTATLADIAAVEVRETGQGREGREGIISLAYNGHLFRYDYVAGTPPAGIRLQRRDGF